MSEFKKIFLKVFVLLNDIFRLAYKLVTEIKLPNKNEKGNVFSSIYIFFIATIERLNVFEHGIFSMTTLLRKKYIKYTIFIIGFILLQLSLFESAADNNILNAPAVATQKLPLDQNILPAICSNKAKIVRCSSKLFFNNEEPEFYNPLLNSPGYLLQIKRFLFIRSLRI